MSARSAADASTDSSSTGSAAPSSRASPFGAARPIDTAAKEREVDEKLAKQRAEAASAQEARNKERDEKKKAAAATESPAAAAAESKSDGAWVRKGPLPPSSQRSNSHGSHNKAKSPSSELPPAVPVVNSVPSAAQRKDGFSYSKAAGKTEGGDVEQVTEGVEQTKLE